MDQNKNHIKTYTAKDIERYHKGGMSAAEMHALEKSALDDPFLSDALEGYTYTKTPAGDLDEIRTRLGEAQKKAKVIPISKNRFQWMKVAASVLVLAAAGWFFYYLSNDPKNDIALSDGPTSQPLEKQDKPLAPGVPQDSTVENSQTTSSDVAIIKQTVLEKDIEAAKETTGEDQTPSNNSRSRDVAATDSHYFRNNVAFRNQASGPSQPRMNFFNGRVVDANNRGLSNATILMENNRAITTDNKGQFTIAAAKDSVLDATVNVSGYRSEQLKLANDEPITVVMKRSDAPLTEVVVLGNDKTKKASSAKRQVIADTLEPAEGWVVFDDYINEKLRSKTDPQIKSASGEVELSFEINKNGEPVNITVERSLCEKCDEEAKRLLKEGPKWKKKKNKKGKVTIKFEGER